MSTKLDFYKVFCKVAEKQSFSGAAKALYMSQPAVSQGIMQMEEELEIRLFTRTPKGVVLTNEGQLLYEYAHSALSLIEVGEKKLMQSKSLVVGNLQIGVGDTISRYYLLPHLETFHRSYPNIKLKIINRTTLELCQMLKAGELDIALCNLPIQEASLEAIPCMAVQDIFVCGEGYKYLLERPLKLEEAAQLPLIMLEPKANSRQVVERYMATKGIKIYPEIELGSHDLLVEFAKINLGVSCVIKEFSKDYLEQGLLYEIPLEEPLPKRSIGFCFLKSVSLSPASAQFVTILEKNML